ncbi:hypothetical protein RJT34_20600 [Clitoria ternatea]|uniref:Uncharacterized protein n=1 Tax=Clitoria ternatea TaxID=43366 RepID=A0AAN9IU47_CLITE
MHRISTIGLISLDKTFEESMAESEKERDNEIDRVEEYEGEEKNNNSQIPDTSLAELNMLLVSLSLFNFSSQECLENEESQQIIKDEAVMAATCIQKLQTRRREKHEHKLGRKPFSSRFQTRIRDSRHGRKM